MFIRFLLLLAFVPFLILPAAGQRPLAEVEIEVIGDGDKLLAGAVIEVAAKRYETGANGTVAIPLASEENELTVRAEGYVPAIVKLEGSAKQVVRLERHEEEVMVSATRSEVRLQDQPNRVEVLGREEIEEKMLMTPGDIVMMLNEMGGLRVQATSPSLGAASVRIQGMRGRYTRFLSDGLPLYGQQVGGLGLLQIPPMDLGQVEVIKGVASSLYGAGAMGGVVNLVSRRPQDKLVREFLLNQSTRGATDAVGFMSSPLSSSWSMSLLGGGHFQQKNDIDDDGWADLAGYKRAIVRPRFFWDGKNGNSLFLTAGTTIENRRGGTVNGSTLTATDLPYLEALDTTSFDIGAVGQFVAAEKYLFSARFAAARRNHDHQFGEVRERDHHDTFFSELTARRTFGQHALVAGAALERDAYTPRDVPKFRFEHWVPGVFLQDDITIAEWFSASVSARYDHHNEFGSFFSPRLAALFRKGGWSSRVSVGQGFFAPTPLTEETEAAGLTRLQVPTALRAERGRSASIDITRTQGAASYSVTFFGSKVKDPIRVERTTTYALVNETEDSSNAGIELLATVRPGPFSVTGSYTFVQSRETEASTRVQTALTPRHSLGIVGMWEEEEKGRLGLEVYYTGRQRLESNPYRAESRPYVIVGALAERKFGKLRAFLNAENLTGVRQTRWDRLLRPDRAPDGRWTVDAWAPLEGRVFNGGVRYQF